MSGAWGGLWGLLRPVAVELHPELEAQLARALRGGGRWLGALTPVVLLAHHATAAGVGWSGWEGSAAVAALNLGVMAAGARGGAALRWRELGLVLQAAALQGWVGLMFPWLGLEAPTLLLGGLMSPFVLCALAPLRPSVAALAAVAMAGPLSLLGLWSASLLGPKELWAAVLVIAGMVALASQLMRQTWASVYRQQERLRASERLAELGRRTAGLAHELKSPMASALNGLYEAQSLHEEFVLSLEHPAVERADLGEIAGEWAQQLTASWHSLVKMESYLQGLQRQASLRGVEGRRAVSVCERFAQLKESFLMLDVLERVALEVEGGEPGLRVSVDVGVFDVIVLNLLRNSLEAAQSSGVGSVIRLRCERASASLRVVVEDDGPGVPEGLREAIFDAMFTTRASQGGTGFGLSMCRDLARGVLGGDLRLEPSPSGARFVLELPLLARSAWGDAEVPA